MKFISFVWSIIGVISILGAIFYFVNPDRFENISLLNKQAKILLNTEASETVDYHGNRIIPEFTKTDTHKTVRLVSPGKDKVLNTYDDVIVEKTDINKSKIVGRWVGKKTKEFAKGIIGGIKEKSF